MIQTGENKMEEIYIVIKKQNGKMNNVFTTRSLLEAITNYKGFMINTSDKDVIYSRTYIDEADDIRATLDSQKFCIFQENSKECIIVYAEI